ncbi:MCE family protein [Aromatoleum toluvorans]|uniref:MCE family protein n=1 Tax=Aromatoleum toluvorans TaxID=92002 RepID=A0ABX1PY04_9RHOO|nr:MlaD family protein [Aromatoleum toluvorans]NMG43119.1 MCE family protein [Aromatoleum toluvorans]
MKLDAESKARIAFAVFLLLLAAGGLGWYLLSAARYTLYQIRTNDPVSGLIPDAPVEYHGVDVGKVERVDLVDARSIRVVLAVRADAPVSAATVATITSRGVATRGFTGYVYIALEDAGTASGPLVARPGEPYPTIPTTASKSMSLDLLISQLNDNVQSLTGLVHGLLDRDTIAALKESADNLRQVTKTLADNNARLNTLIANGEAASRRLQPLLQSSQHTIDSLQPLVRSSQDLVATMQPLVRSSRDTVDALQLQLVPQAYRVLTQLDELTVSLDGIADKVSRDPISVIRGAPARRPGPGERP